MTMHLEGPWLTTNGRWKTKRRRYFSAESAARERELAAEWQQRQADWAKLSPKFSAQRRPGPVGQPLARTSVSPQYPPGREPQAIPSRDTGGGSTARPADKVYTGTKIKGIGTMHKSNAVPIFSDDEAQDIAHMRR